MIALMETSESSFFSTRSLVRAVLISRRSAKPSGAPLAILRGGQDRGFRDLDSLEESLVVSFVQGGFIFQLPGNAPGAEEENS